MQIKRAPSASKAGLSPGRTRIGRPSERRGDSAHRRPDDRYRLVGPTNGSISMRCRQEERRDERPIYSGKTPWRGVGHIGLSPNPGTDYGTDLPELFGAAGYRRVSICAVETLRWHGVHFGGGIGKRCPRRVIGMTAHSHDIRRVGVRACANRRNKRHPNSLILVQTSQPGISAVPQWP